MRIKWRKMIRNMERLTGLQDKRIGSPWEIVNIRKIYSKCGCKYS